MGKRIRRLVHRVCLLITVGVLAILVVDPRAGARVLAQVTGPAHGQSITFSPSGGAGQAPPADAASHFTMNSWDAVTPLGFRGQCARPVHVALVGHASPADSALVARTVESLDSAIVAAGGRHGSVVFDGRARRGQASRDGRGSSAALTVEIVDYSRTAWHDPQGTLKDKAGVTMQATDTDSDGDGTADQVRHAWQTAQIFVAPGYFKHDGRLGSAVLAHELGHAVGLGHVQDEFQVMNTYANPHNVDQYGSGDLAGLAQLFSRCA